MDTRVSWHASKEQRRYFELIADTFDHRSGHPRDTQERLVRGRCHDGQRRIGECLQLFMRVGRKQDRAPAGKADDGAPAGAGAQAPHEQETRLNNEQRALRHAICSKDAVHGLAGHVSRRTAARRLSRSGKPAIKRLMRPRRSDGSSRS